jgi:hypothetical protein
VMLNDSAPKGVLLLSFVKGSMFNGQFENRSETSDSFQLSECRECFNYRKICHIKEIVGFEKLN